MTLATIRPALANGYVFASPTGAPLIPNTDYHRWKQLLEDAGVRDGRLHDARNTAGTVLPLLGVPDVVVDAIMGWEPGGAARMRARYMHVTGPMLKKVAGRSRKPRPGSGRGSHLPWRAGAEDTRFELVRGCPQHAFQLFVRQFRRVRHGPDLRLRSIPGG